MTMHYVGQNILICTSSDPVHDTAEIPSTQAWEPKLEETEVAVSTDCPPSQDPVHYTAEAPSPQALKPKLEETEVAVSTDCPPSQDPVHDTAETPSTQAWEPKLEETEVAVSTDCPPSPEPVHDTAEAPSPQALEPKLEETEVAMSTDCPPSPEPVYYTAETPSPQALEPEMYEIEVELSSDHEDDQALNLRKRGTAKKPGSQKKKKHAGVHKTSRNERVLSEDESTDNSEVDVRPPNGRPLGTAIQLLSQKKQKKHAGVHKTSRNKRVLSEGESTDNSEAEEERPSKQRKLGTAKKQGSQKKQKKHAGVHKTSRKERVLSEDESTDNSEAEEERPSKRQKLGTAKKQGSQKKQKKHAGVHKTSRNERVLSEDESTDNSEAEEERPSKQRKLGTAKKQGSQKKQKKHAGVHKTSRNERVLSEDESTDNSEAEEERPSKQRKLGTAKKQGSQKKKKHAGVHKTGRNERVLSEDESTDNSEAEEERPSKQRKLGTAKKQGSQKKQKKHAGVHKTSRNERVLSEDESTDNSEAEEGRPSKRQKLGTAKKQGSQKKKKHAGVHKTGRNERVLSEDESTDNSEAEEERPSKQRKLGTAKKQGSQKKQKKHAGVHKTSRNERVLSEDESTDNSEAEEERPSKQRKLGTAKKQGSQKKVHHRSSQEPELQESSRSEEDHENALEWEYQEDIECEGDAEDELILKYRTRNSNNQKAPRRPQQIPRKLFMPTNEIKWSSSPDIAQPYCPATLHKVPGPTKLAVRQVSDIRSAFELFISKSIQKDLLKMTNLEGKRIYRKQWKDMDDVDMHAFYGVLILSSVYKSKREKPRSLWDPKTGRPIFSAVMSWMDFNKCTNCLRFDKWKKECARQQEDELAEIQPVWDKWVEQLPLMYNPGSNVTVDERLIKFKGRCSFKQYMPSKLARYGIKIWAACDAASSYAWNMQICTEKAKDVISKRDQGMRVMFDMTQGLSGHHITCGGFFTSYDLGQKLLKRNMTMVGPILRKKPELPPEISTLKERKVTSSEFLYTANTTLVSYISRKGKNVILMSTLHREGQISDREDKKPEMILHYNATKGGVDNLDRLMACYSCQRKTLRWPHMIFYNMMDISAYNAFVIWLAIQPDWEKSNSNKRWRLFLEELGRELVLPHIQRTERIPRAPAAALVIRRFRVEAAVTTGAGFNPPLPTAAAGGVLEKRCQDCPPWKDATTASVCTTCKRFICVKHRVKLCFGCV
ncbi:nucleolar protein dao-5-like isoform X5 [Brienomyrus brachyistius]|uniref:nucleolar protein dao-5-like isoform X5 n=1 Tax=Brienomyrus brachyistius TaxID=42636 RepID=UPI0020B418F9|nr:nucleolar protein dao-5-like isoform X5 [Brienomyrus brachyistius]